MASYGEQLAQWRVQRRQRDIADRLGMIRQEYAEAARERDQALRDGDVVEAECRDQDCERLESEWREYVPEQTDPRLVRFAQQNQQFFEKYGPRAYQALAAAHEYMMRPRRTDTNDPRYRGMGWNPKYVFTPAYFDNLKSLLELHGEQFLGVQYDRKEQGLTPNEAAKISGLSPQSYNRALHEVAAQGRLGTDKK
jgi:hypothetical protein